MIKGDGKTKHFINCNKFIWYAKGENVGLLKAVNFIIANQYLPRELLIKKLNRMIYANQQYNADKIKFFKKKLKEIDVEVIMQLGAILKEKEDQRICAIPSVSTGIKTISKTREVHYQQPIDRVASRVIKKGKK